MEVDLNSLEAPDEPQTNTVTHKTANTNADQPKPTCRHCEKPEYYRNHCRLLERQKKQTEDTESNPGNKIKTVAPETPSQTTIQTITLTTTSTKIVKYLIESKKLFMHPVRHLERQTTPQRIAIMEPIQPTDRLRGTEDQKDRIRSKKEPIKVTRMKLLWLQPKI